MTSRKSASNVISMGRKDLLSVVVPVFNEQECIINFHEHLAKSLAGMESVNTEIIYINDGSTDQSMAMLLQILQREPGVEIIDLSRNFGKEAAMTAGLKRANGDAVIIIDADLQDPPELIPEMVKQWRSGYDIINMRRAGRSGESWLKKGTARAFYFIMARFGPVKMPPDVGDFRLLSRRAVAALQQLPERTRFMKGLFAWIGFPVKEIEYQRNSRLAGTTKWNYWRLWNLALDGITSYSVAPLKAASLAGILTAVSAFIYGIYVVVKTLRYGDPVPGYPSLLVIILLLGGLQLVAIGLVGEYLGRMFLESKQRPLYLVKRHYAAPKPVLTILPDRQRESL